MIEATYRISLAGNLQAWIPLPCGGGALSPLLLAELLLPVNTGKQDLFSIQLHVLVERFSHSKCRQTVPVISFCLRKAREKGNTTFQSASLLVAQSTRAHQWSQQLEDPALP